MLSASHFSRIYGFTDACSKRKQNFLLKNSFASVSMGDEKPFDFLRTLFGRHKIFFSGVVHIEYICQCWCFSRCFTVSLFNLLSSVISTQHKIFTSYIRDLAIKPCLKDDQQGNAIPQFFIYEVKN